MKLIQEKEAIAKRLVVLFGHIDFDKEVRRIQGDPWGAL